MLLEFKNRVAAIEYWRGKAAAYRTTFNSQYGPKVLRDLADFCHAFKTTESPENERLSALREGRRQVWLFIMHRLNLTPEQLSALYRDVINGEE